MNIQGLSREERQRLVLEDVLPAHALSDEDIADLERRVFDAICDKQLNRKDVQYFEHERKVVQ